MVENMVDPDPPSGPPRISVCQLRQSEIRPRHSPQYVSKSRRLGTCRALLSASELAFLVAQRGRAAPPTSTLKEPPIFMQVSVPSTLMKPGP